MLNPTGLMYRYPGGANLSTDIVPSAVFSSAVNFYKHRFGSRDGTPRRKFYMLPDSAYGFHKLVPPTSSLHTGGIMRLSLTGSVDRLRLTNARNVSGRPTRRENSFVSVDAFGVTWQIVG